MARWRRSFSDVPRGLCWYSAETFGPGDSGVRAWKRAALAWLAEDPERRLPFGEHGGPLDVLRETIRLLHDAASVNGHGHEVGLDKTGCQRRGLP